MFAQGLPLEPLAAKVVYRYANGFVASPPVFRSPFVEFKLDQLKLRL